MLQYSKKVINKWGLGQYLQEWTKLLATEKQLGDSWLVTYGSSALPRNKCLTVSYWIVWSVGEFVTEILSSFFDCSAKKCREYPCVMLDLKVISTEVLSRIGPSYFTFEAQWRDLFSWWYNKYFTQVWFQLLVNPLQATVGKVQVHL